MGLFDSSGELRSSRGRAVWAERAAQAFAVGCAFGCAFLLSPAFGWKQLLPLLCALALAARQVYAQGRWQLLPAALALLAEVAMLVAAPQRLGAPICVAALWLAAALSAALCWLLPTPVLPALRGTHKVGTCELNLVDERRAVWPQGPDVVGSSNRLVPCCVWYPALPVEEGMPKPRRTLYWRGREKLIAMGQAFGMPWWFLLPFAAWNSRSRVELLPAAPQAHLDGFPVMIFTHSWTGCREQSTLLFEELGSLGHVVVAMDHIGDTPLSIFAEDADLLGRNDAGASSSSAAGDEDEEERWNDGLLSDRDPDVGRTAAARAIAAHAGGALDAANSEALLIWQGDTCFAEMMRTCRGEGDGERTGWHERALQVHIDKDPFRSC